MQILTTLNVSAEEFFQLIENSLLYDIENSGKKKVEASQLEKGFHYTKNLMNGKKAVVSNVTLLQYKKPSNYEIKVETGDTLYYIKYAIVPNGDKIDVAYSEHSTDKDGNERTSFIMKLMGKSNAKRLKNTLKQMEDVIIKNRGENSPIETIEKENS